jgi:hypothetical protein
LCLCLGLAWTLIFLPMASHLAGITGTHHHAQLIDWDGVLLHFCTSLTWFNDTSLSIPWTTPPPWNSWSLAILASLPFYCGFLDPQINKSSALRPWTGSPSGGLPLLLHSLERYPWCSHISPKRLGPFWSELCITVAIIISPGSISQGARLSKGISYAFCAFLGAYERHKWCLRSMRILA